MSAAQDARAAAADAELVAAAHCETLQRSKGEKEKEALLLARLSTAVGPRGIQHYVFVGLLGALEDVANQFLDVLADGGLQLRLEGEVPEHEKDRGRRNHENHHNTNRGRGLADDVLAGEGGGRGEGKTACAGVEVDTHASVAGPQETLVLSDRIRKSVWVRSADSQEFRERALGQLSGGQWRRVSLALDLVCDLILLSVLFFVWFFSFCVFHALQYVTLYRIALHCIRYSLSFLFLLIILSPPSPVPIFAGFRRAGAAFWHFAMQFGGDGRDPDSFGRQGARCSCLTLTWHGEQPQRLSE
jgi:hypothetical protein